MSATSDRRNERARAAGWASYSQKYRGEKLGYRSPGEYVAAKGEAGRQRRAIEPTPWAPMRQRADGVQVGSLGGGRRGIVGTRESLGGVESELGRYSKSDRRVSIFVGGVPMGGKRGFSLGFVREQIDEFGSLEAWIEVLEAGSYDGGDGGGAVSVTVS